MTVGCAHLRVSFIYPCASIPARGRRQRKRRNHRMGESNPRERRVENGKRQPEAAARSREATSSQGDVASLPLAPRRFLTGGAAHLPRQLPPPSSPKARPSKREKRDVGVRKRGRERRGEGGRPTPRTDPCCRRCSPSTGRHCEEHKREKRARAIEKMRWGTHPWGRDVVIRWAPPLALMVLLGNPGCKCFARGSRLACSLCQF
jgi:hypothetical protein